MRAGYRVVAATAAVLTTLAAPLAAEPLPVDRQATHPNGSTLRVRAVELLDDVTRVDVTVTTANREVRLNRNNSMVLVGDDDRRLRLVPPPENEEVDIPPNSRLTGEMIFAGRVPPSTRRLVLSTNEGVGGSGDNQYTNLPIFEIALPLPLPLPPRQPAAGAAAVPAPMPPTGGGAPAGGAPAEASAGEGTPAPAGVAAVPPVAVPPAATTTAAVASSREVRVDRQEIHPNGSVMTVASLEGTDDGTTVLLRISTADREIRLNRGSSLRLVDDKGNSYRAVPPTDNPELKLPRNSRVEARVLFAGRLDPAATRVTLTSNEGVGGSEDNQHTELPVFRIAIPLRQG